MNSSEHGDRVPSAANRKRLLRRGAVLGAAAVIATADLYALNTGALDDVPVVIKEGGALAVEKSPQLGRAVLLAEHTELDITCQVSAHEVIGVAKQGTKYGVDPDFLLPQSTDQQTAYWTDNLHDCSQPIQYRTQPRTP